jgi:hypothetical protein
LIAAAIILLAVLAGAAFFFLRRQQQPAAVVAAPVVPAATVAPPPTPSTTTAPPAAVDPETSAKVAKLIGSGNRALARGDADIAAEFFDQALSLDPTSAEAQAGLRKARKP